MHCNLPLIILSGKAVNIPLLRSGKCCSPHCFAQVLYQLSFLSLLGWGENIYSVFIEENVVFDKDYNSFLCEAAEPGKQCTCLA